ncbi:MAG: redox-active disulfide protein 2 [uncultured bacterium]|nr:MAG: redox-active disulfide protein 2 [uncultured bacterium]
MNVKVLGTGCATCKKLHESVVKAVGELNLGVEVEYITDVQAMLDLGVMSSPVLVINDVPVAVGQVPSFDKIKQLLAESKAIPAIMQEKPAGSCNCSCGDKC